MNRRLLLPRERGIVRFAELWLDGEELLYVHSSRFSDSYSRYRLRDIQAFVLTEHPLWNVWRAWWLGLSLFLTVVLMIAPPRAWKLWAILPGIFLLWAVFHLLRGPRCRLVLHTAVSTVTLEAVRTMAQAKAVLPVLKQATEAVQGRLAPDGLTVTAMPSVAPEAPPSQNNPMLLHVLFGMMVLHALILVGFYFGNKMDSGLGVSGTLLVSEIVLGALTAIRWRAVGPMMTIVSVLVLILAVADTGVLIYSTVKSFGGFFEAVSQRGAKPEDMEWLWLKEQTTGRATWHAIAGVVGWALVLASKGKRP